MTLRLAEIWTLEGLQGKV